MPPSIPLLPGTSGEIPRRSPNAHEWSEAAIMSAHDQTPAARLRRLTTSLKHASGRGDLPLEIKAKSASVSLILARRFGDRAQFATDR